jgi:hypothetical protein
LGDHLEDLCIGWRIILEWIFREVMCGTGLAITITWSPLTTRNFQLASNFQLDIWELAFGDADAV